MLTCSRKAVCVRQQGKKEKRMKATVVRYLKWASIGVMVSAGLSLLVCIAVTTWGPAQPTPLSESLTLYSLAGSMLLFMLGLLLATAFATTQSLSKRLPKGAVATATSRRFAPGDRVQAMLDRLGESPGNANEMASPSASDKLHPGDSAPKPVAEAWQKFAGYVRIPEDAPDSERRANMRFQFMFSGSAEADRVMSSLPDSLRSTLPSPQHEGFAPPGAGPDVEGKYTVWYEGVSLTLGEGKDLMNRVVEAGGGIYEAFLT